MRTVFFARVCAGLIGGGLLAWLAALILSLPSEQPVVAIVLRTLLVLAVAVLTVRLALLRALGELEGRRSIWSSLLFATALSYAIFPPSWAGRGLLGQLFVAPGVTSWLIDALLWSSTALLTAYLSGMRGPEPEPALPYSVVVRHPDERF